MDKKIDLEKIMAAGRQEVQKKYEPIVDDSTPSKITLFPAETRLPWEDEPEIEDSASQETEMPLESPIPQQYTYWDNTKEAKRDYKLPPTNLLEPVPSPIPYKEEELKNVARGIKAKLADFLVEGDVVQINPGPVVTTYEFNPAPGTPYSKIANLREDLCLALQAESIRMERIPGKTTVGIEIPNIKREVVSMRQILESEEFKNSASVMTIAMGKDIVGRPKLASLETMPHLLIAGSTGSGKSILMNSIITSVLFKSKPDEVKMILVDPKRVEFNQFNGLPHLVEPVITDPRKAIEMLKEAVGEMERRLRLLAENGARNIDQYNKTVENANNLVIRGSKEEEKLPKIVIVIDELADLMLQNGREAEEYLTRLAQMARAVGIHMVIGTQRPSVDVITGLIKANFPARIGMRVTTRVDSRTILDVMGAEHLLGKGDMLFLPPGSSRLTRIQGTFISESETTKVVDFWKSQVDSSVPEPKPSSAHTTMEDRDTYIRALELKIPQQANITKGQVIETLRGVIEKATQELAKNRKIREDLLRELAEIRKVPVETPPAGEIKETSEIQTYSTEFIRNQIRNLLSSNKNIKEIKNIRLRGNGKEMLLEMQVQAGPLSSDIGIQATLESREGVVVVKNHKIDANFMIRGTVEDLLVPKLKEVSQMLRVYIEKEKQKKVEKMEIINGELKVVFK